MVHFTGEKSETGGAIDHGSRSKVVGISWKYPSSDFQDPRESWGDAQDTKKVE